MATRVDPQRPTLQEAFRSAVATGEVGTSGIAPGADTAGNGGRRRGAGSPHLNALTPSFDPLVADRPAPRIVRIVACGLTLVTTLVLALAVGAYLAQRHGP